MTKKEAPKKATTKKAEPKVEETPKETPAETEEPQEPKSEEPRPTELVNDEWALTYDPRYDVWHLRQKNWVGPAQVTAKESTFTSLKELLGQF